MELNGRNLIQIRCEELSYFDLPPRHCDFALARSPVLKPPVLFSRGGMTEGVWSQSKGASGPFFLALWGPPVDSGTNQFSGPLNNRRGLGAISSSAIKYRAMQDLAGHSCGTVQYPVRPAFDMHFHRLAA